MMRLFINSLAASAGGGLTYIRNVLPHLAAHDHLSVTVALQSGLRNEFAGFSNIQFLEPRVSQTRRFFYEQSALPDLIRGTQADVLLSSGNFALRRSPVPQILLSRNSIYTSSEFFRDLLARHEYRMWLDTRFRAGFAKRSIRWADLTVAPSEAFAAELRRWSGADVLALHHGFDLDDFTRDTTPLAREVEVKLSSAESSLKVLFVSHYNYYRNFETLIRSLPLLREQLPSRSVKLLLTCRLTSGGNPGAYRTETASELVKELGVSDIVVELGAIPYRQLHHLYRRADLYVTPAYTETFAHPLVEAMASGLPVIASDLPVHREICGEAAAYFPRFSAEALANTVSQIAPATGKLAAMRRAGLARSSHFSWKAHTNKILELCHMLVDRKPLRS